MDWLNYHHLLYFYVVASEGSVTAACARLHLAQPTISSQLRKLERSLGCKLFERSGRNLVLTETGRLVFEYAEGNREEACSRTPWAIRENFTTRSMERLAGTDPE